MPLLSLAFGYLIPPNKRHTFPLNLEPATDYAISCKAKVNKSHIAETPGVGAAEALSVDR